MAVIHKISKDNKEILVRIVSHICLILFDVSIKSTLMYTKI